MELVDTTQNKSHVEDVVKSFLGPLWNCEYTMPSEHKLSIWRKTEAKGDGFTIQATEIQFLLEHFYDLHRDNKYFRDYGNNSN